MPLSWTNEEPVVKIFVFNGADCANYFAPLPMELYNLLQLQCSIVTVYLDVLVCRGSRERAQSDSGGSGKDRSDCFDALSLAVLCTCGCGRTKPN